MKEKKKGEQTPSIMIEGYKVIVQVTDKPISLTDVFNDLLGRKLEKIWILSGQVLVNAVK